MIKVTIRLLSLIFVLVACSPDNKVEENKKSLQNLDPFSIDAPSFSEKELLGSKIFTDTRLSNPEGQACISCHSPNNAFSDSRKEFPVSRGAMETHFGGRNAPSAMYMKFTPSPKFESDGEGGENFVGGLFLDGRSPALQDQAKAPFLNPLEMGSTRLYVLQKVCSSQDYGALFKKVFGPGACPESSWTDAQIEKSYGQVAEAIASFESTDFFSPFSSKFDRVMANQDQFSNIEALGFQVFKKENRGNCAACHVLEIHPQAKRELFTDFSYDNLGIPANPEVAKLGFTQTDEGLAGTTQRKKDRGLFRVPSLRNIALTAPYGHNGYFKTLEQIIDFYNTRDVKPSCALNLSVEDSEKLNCWSRPEVPETVNHNELGNLQLTKQDQQALIEFLKTLTDVP